MRNDFRLKRRWLLATLALIQAGLLAFGTSLFAAQSASEGPSFKGKTLRILVHTSPGGGYDTYSRLLARHLPRFIPGEPTAIVQNMTGGGGLIAANYLYNRAPRDGTVMMAVPWHLPILQLIGQRGVRFDMKKMSALGSADFETNIIFTRKDRFATFEELLKSKQPAKLASVGPGGISFTTGSVVETVAGKKLFDIIRGYGSGRDYALAIKKGEVDGAGFQFAVMKLYLGDMWEAGELAILVQAGVEGKPDPQLPDVPLISEIAKTPEAKRTAELMYPALTFGRGFWLPLEVPEKRVEFMRGAFWQVMQDAKFLAEAKKLGRTINPMRGKEVQEMWDGVLGSPPEVVELYQKIFKPER
jgi:tripartite-type tricarboxylate transporter receptor subunit TctC